MHKFCVVALSDYWIGFYVRVRLLSSALDIHGWNNLRALFSPDFKRAKCHRCRFAWGLGAMRWCSIIFMFHHVATIKKRTHFNDFVLFVRSLKLLPSFERTPSSRRRNFSNDISNSNLFQSVVDDKMSEWCYYRLHGKWIWYVNWEKTIGMNLMILTRCIADHQLDRFNMHIIQGKMRENACQLSVMRK